MSKRVGIKEAAKITGLSEWELRRGSKENKYPYIKVGGKNGKLIFDIELLELHISNMMMENINKKIN